MERSTLTAFAFGVLAGSTVALLVARRSFAALASSTSKSSSGGETEGKRKLKADLHNLSRETIALLQGKGEAGPQMGKRVFSVCLTGGPCSGKSSSLSAFAQALTSRGLDVYSVPEVPTIIMNSGFPYPGLEGKEMLMAFEEALFRTQLQLEDTTRSMASQRDSLERHRPSVIFFDRGLGDMKAYMPPGMWGELLDTFQLTEQDIAGRYDLVIHLVTAADGALDFYTTANNAARTETPEQARENDRRVRDAWADHPHRAIVDNSGPSFQTKIQRATDLVLHLVEHGVAETEIEAGAAFLQTIAAAATKGGAGAGDGEGAVSGFSS
jgi:predicted ATPase